MNIEKFKKAINFQDPMLCVQGDIFETPADHIAFAVNYPNSEGEYNNSDTGFAAKVCEDHWPELANIKFEKAKSALIAPWVKLFMLWRFIPTKLEAGKMHLN
ncbi:MAG: hypothetical protein WC564_03790 [Patescibacteria group bacterium]